MMHTMWPVIENRSSSNSFASVGSCRIISFGSSTVLANRQEDVSMLYVVTVFLLCIICATAVEK